MISNTTEATNIGTQWEPLLPHQALSIYDIMNELADDEALWEPISHKLQAKSANVGVQVEPFVFSVFGHRDSEQEFKHYSDITEHTWEPLINPPGELKEGDFVELKKNTVSANPNLTLQNGLKGCIKKLDKDGDAMMYVYFPEANFNRLGYHWVGHTDCLPILRSGVT